MKYNKKIEHLLKSKSQVNISLGGASIESKNYINVDIKPGLDIDIVHDLETYPWPFPDECADLIIASHIVEHVNPAKFGFINWMNEAWRILKVGGQMMVGTPYAGSIGYWQDPTHINGCNEITFYYFDPDQQIDKQELYHYYKPKPWKVQNIAFNIEGNLEVLLIKRKENTDRGKA